MWGFAAHGTSIGRRIFCGAAATRHQTLAKRPLAADNPRGGYPSFIAWPAEVCRINESWSVGGRLAYTNLTSDAANAPIARRGSRDQSTGGIGIAYPSEATTTGANR